MGEKTKIEWTDYTFNPWWGCTRVSEGCAHCYAETFAKRLGHQVWGKGNPRRFFGDKHWDEPVKWDRWAANEGTTRRVFCASMADVFEDAPGLEEVREKLWDLIADTPHLEWLLLTKRPENLVLLPSRFIEGKYPDNVRVGITIENQAVAGQRLADLARWWNGKNFISVEPMLRPVSIARELEPCEWDWDQVNMLDVEDPEEFIEECELECDWVNYGNDLVSNPEYREHQVWRKYRAQIFAMESGIDWVIIGGESGAGARPMEIPWAVDLVKECEAAKVPVFVKQLGGHPDKRQRMGEWPEWLRVRQFPKEGR